MGLNLSGVPKSFIDGINRIKIADNYETKDECDTIGTVYISRAFEDDKAIGSGFYVVCGGSYMDKCGKFDMHLLDDEKAFYKERLFESIESAWDTFFSNN